MELNRIYNEDCVDNMGRMPDNFIDLTVTSPPYGKLRKYKGFQFDFESIAENLYRVLKNNGVVVWIVGDQTIEGSECCIPFEQALYFKKVGFSLYDTMIWLKPSPQAPTEGRYYDVFEYMFVFCKGKKPKVINYICDRKNKTAGTVLKKESRSSKEQRRFKDENRIVKEYSRRFNVWEICPERTRKNHPAVFPEALARDHIISWSNEGDLVYDPMCGSGTTCVAAKKLGRNFIGCDVSQEYCKLAESQLEGEK